MANTKKEEKMKYYTLDNILEKNAEYNVIYGERSNGKTTAVLLYGLKRYLNSERTEQMAIVRRWEEDFKGKNGANMFSGIVGMGVIHKWTNGEYNSVYHYGGRWYLCLIDEESGKRTKTTEEPFALGFSITSEEHYKSTSYPRITTILFDEFLTRGYYLPDEFVKFQNLLSTIIRLRDNVKIFMCGNTINKYSPYFNEMGLTNIRKQEKGTIDIYTYGESTLKVAVEYSDFQTKKKASNKYFAFNNPKLNMITNGGWEIDIYPHLPERYKPDEVISVFYIKFDGYILQGNVIVINDKVFLYLHKKTTPIKDELNRVIYTEEISNQRNIRYNFLKPSRKQEKKYLELYKQHKVFYQDNEIGEIMNNYIKWCEQN